MNPDWSEIPLLAPSADVGGYIPLPEDGGWGILLAWCARRNARYRPVGQRATSVIHYPEGVRRVWPRTKSEQAELDDDVRAYCEDAGIPPPPPGRDWWVVRPGRVSDAEFFSAINAALATAGGRTPAEDRKAIQLFLDAEYG